MAGKRSTDFYIGKVGITGTIPAPTGVALETTQGAVKTAVEALAALISSGSLKAVLTAGSAAFGKLAANAGVVIGAVEIAASQTIALAAGAQVIGHVILDAGSAAIGKLAANSGVDIGDVDVTSITPPAAIFADVKNVTTAGSRVALGSQALARGVFVRAKRGNTGLIYVGTAAAVSSTVYGVELLPGEWSPLIPCSNLSLVGLDSSVNGEGVSYLAA